MDTLFAGIADAVQDLENRLVRELTPVVVQAIAARVIDNLDMGDLAQKIVDEIDLEDKIKKFFNDNSFSVSLVRGRHGTV